MSVSFKANQTIEYGKKDENRRSKKTIYCLLVKKILPRILQLISKTLLKYLVV